MSNAKDRKVKSTIEHGEIVDIPIDAIEPNPWNPNEMAADEFNMLSENLDDVDFLQPLLVVPIREEHGKQIYRIIDGEQRYMAQRLRDVENIKCVVADPERIPEIKQKFQTVRMNKIKGTLNTKKFNDLVSSIVSTGEYEFDELAHQFGFVDEDEFQLIIDSARESLPDNPDMRKEFDAAREDIKTVDDLSLVLNRLFTKYGDTLPWNFMILDWGGKEQIWVRMSKRDYDKAKAQARKVVDLGVTFDSVVGRFFSLLDMDKFVEKHRDFLEKVEDKNQDLKELTDVI